MGKRKAPEADGLSVLFYWQHWDIIGEEVTHKVIFFLNGGAFPTSLNHTLIALIPKVKSLITPKDYRPISLCNVLYKLASKVLANKLKTVVDEVISPNESAFVLGRFITDNVMAAFECFHAMKTKEKGQWGVFAAKIDMAKAYDKVEWSFLEGVMRKMGFQSWWVELIMQCVSTVTY
ncbi:unnamed protein product [Linum trigynum]|uniref:Reverse transcriptase domain-containing protein n=1 Tax=Linum trigynum TaxID=586398 RepID=A0AAV2FCJ3_9ROSI